MYNNTHWQGRAVSYFRVFSVYGVQVVYNAQLFHEDSESGVVSGWLNLYPQCLRIAMYLAYFIDVCMVDISYIIRFTVNPVCAKLHTYNSRTHYILRPYGCRSV